MANLVRAIEDLYTAFADIARPSSIEGCRCCIGESELKRLLRVPLRQVTASELAPYASSALLTVGSVEDYLYFLPRILEVSVTDEDWWPDIAVTGRAIRSTMPESWARSQKNAVQAFFESVFQSLILEESYGRIDDWICGAARSGFDVGPLLKIVEGNDAAILEFFNCNAGALAERKLGNAFWEPGDTGQDEILNWFMSENIRRVPYEAYGYRIFE